MGWLGRLGLGVRRFADYKESIRRTAASTAGMEISLRKNCMNDWWEGLSTGFGAVPFPSMPIDAVKIPVNKCLGRAAEAKLLMRKWVWWCDEFNRDLGSERTPMADTWQWCPGHDKPIATSPETSLMMLYVVPWRWDQGRMCDTRIWLELAPGWLMWCPILSSPPIVSWNH